MRVALSNFITHVSSRQTHAFMLPLMGLPVKGTFNSSPDPQSKKPLTAFPTSSASMLGSMSAISTSILGMRWRADPLALITSLNVKYSHLLSSLEHLSLTRRSLQSVFLIPWTVMPSSSGLTHFFKHFNMTA